MGPTCVPIDGRFDGAPEDSKLDKDFKRDADHRHKYSLGAMDVGTRTKPVLPSTSIQRFSRKDKMRGDRRHQAAAAQSKQVNTDLATSDSSADEEVREASAAPEPDASITYSYDAQHGPSQGSQILSLAINKAVERYENKATDKLIKDEYEVVVPEAETETRNDGYVADEDDYELV